jgi:hypothetical protein
VDGVVSQETQKVELTPPRGKEVIKKLKERTKQKTYGDYRACCLTIKNLYFSNSRVHIFRCSSLYPRGEPERRCEESRKRRRGRSLQNRVGALETADAARRREGEGTYRPQVSTKTTNQSWSFGYEYEDGLFSSPAHFFGNCERGSLFQQCISLLIGIGSTPLAVL